MFSRHHIAPPEQIDIKLVYMTFLLERSSMDNQPLKNKITGGILLAVGLFFLASLFSHNPAEGPIADFAADGGGITNWCGAVGAWISCYSLILIGSISYFVAFGFMLCGYFLLAGLPDGSWTGKITGLLIALLAVTLISGLPFIETHASWAKQSLSPGVLGILLTRWLHTSIGWGGTLGLTVVGLVGGVMLLIGEPLKRIISSVPHGLKTVKNTIASLNLLPGSHSTESAPDSSATPPSRPADSRSRHNATGSAEQQSRPEFAPKQSVSSAEDSAAHGTEQQSQADNSGNSGDGPEILERRDTGTPDESNFGRAMKKHEQKTAADDEFDLPPLDILDEPADTETDEDKNDLKKRGEILEKTLEEFNIEAEVVRVQEGPVVTMYEIALAAGTKVSKVETLDDDMAIALKAPNVRIVAPLPGKSTVGIEVPNQQREIVRLRELLCSMDGEAADMAIPLFLGKDTAGDPLIVDLAKAPHLLIAGATGSGKSVALNSIISSILMTRTPEEAQLLLMDPKSVEFSDYKELPHLICPILTDMKKAAGVLEWACKKMDERFSMLNQVNVRNVHDYNQLGRREIVRRLDPEDEAEVDDVPFYMPHTVIVVDELGELMMVAAKDVESSIIRLSQKARAVGIHLICATQRPSADVITGLIKANLPARIAFQVSSKVNSRVILDRNGAELLLGSGDMLMKPPATSKLVRAQGTYVSQKETKNLVDSLAEQGQPHFKEELQNMNATSDPQDHDDELYEEAVRIVLENQRGSVSLLQRRLAIGYTRAARLVDMMAEAGIVGTHRGSKAREVLLTLEEWEEAREDA